MDARPAPNRRPVLACVPLVLAAVLVGCGQIGSASPSQGPGTSEPSLLATPSPAASTPAPTRAGVVIRSVDPNLEAVVPAEGWFVLGPAGYEAQLRLLLTEFDDPVLRRAIESELETIEAGRLRDIAAHPRGPIIGLFVLPPAATLEDALAARRTEVEANAPPFTIVSSESTTDLFIPGYRSEFQSDLEPGVPTRTIEYLGILADNRVVVLNGTAPLDFAGFPELMTQVARSLRAT